ncbi:MAG: hypothetical protein AAFY34_00790 [Pseudomonadota bacterium]
MKKVLMATSLLVAGTASAHEVIHLDHAETHIAGDGHIAINHDGHIDHLHDGHLHHAHGAHVDEHVIAVSAINPVAEEIVSSVDDAGHTHSADDSAHPRIQHGDHFDYLHNGRLHYVHGDHVDDHGPIDVISAAP